MWDDCDIGSSQVPPTASLRNSPGPPTPSVIGYKSGVKRIAALCLFASVSACGDDAPLGIARRWTFTDTVALAAPGTGTDRRVIVARKTAPGQLQTLDAITGRNVEGPFDILPTPHAPVMVQAEIFLIGQVSGRVVGLNLAGELLDLPDLSVGGTAPIVSAPDGGLRIASNRGELHIIGVNRQTPLQAPLPGVSDTPPAVDSAGITFVATDVGRVVGIDANANSVFEVNVPAPASGVAVTEQLVAVGALDGVYVFDRNAQSVFHHPRDARVVGTRFAADGDILAWGEDGVLDRLSPKGDLRFSLKLGPPIYAPVSELADGSLAVFDNDGTGYLIKDGAILDQIDVAPEETAAPERQVARGPDGFIYVTRGNTVAAFDFAFAR